MQIFIHTLTGRVLEVEAEAAHTVFDIKQKIESLYGTPNTDQRLIFNSKQLQDSWTLFDYNVGNASSLQLCTALKGGDIEPSLAILARKYNCEKMICRKCYARLPPKATNCRKKKCGRSNQLRPKKKGKRN